MQESWLVLVPEWPCADGLSGTPGMSPVLNYRAYSNWSLATYPFFSSSKTTQNNAHSSPPHISPALYRDEEKNNAKKLENDQNPKKMVLTDDPQQELSNEYQQDLIRTVYEYLCSLVFEQKEPQ